MHTSSVLNLLNIVAFTRLVTVLTQDLCSVSVIDSIAYIDDTKQYFITSGAYYYVVKDSDMTPREGKKLHHGWDKVDAAFYMDWLHECGTLSNVNIIPEDRDVILVSMRPTGNHYMIYDVTDSLLETKEAFIGEYRVLTNIRIDNWAHTVDAMFTYPHMQVYAIQNGKYAGANWANMCHFYTQNARQFELVSDAKTHFEASRKIDAITYKDGVGFYVFTGDHFYILPIDKQRSGNGTFHRTIKGTPKLIWSDFLKCGPSPDSSTKKIVTPVVPVVTPPAKPPTTTTTTTTTTVTPIARPPTTASTTTVIPAVHSTSTRSPPQRSDADTDPDQQKTDTTTEELSSVDDKGKKSPILWIIIGIILLIIIIAIVIILIIVAMRRKRKAELKLKEKSITKSSEESDAKSDKPEKSSKPLMSEESELSVSSRRSKHSKSKKYSPEKSMFSEKSAKSVTSRRSTHSTAHKSGPSSKFISLEAKSGSSPEHSFRSKATDN